MNKNLDLNKENPIKDSTDSKPTSSSREFGGGKQEEWRQFLTRVGQNYITNFPQGWEDMVIRAYEIKNNCNVGESIRPRIDDSKLIIPLHVKPENYKTHEELYVAIFDWWTKTKKRSPKTVITRIRHARSMQKHLIFPVDWLKFEPEQILNQLIHRQVYEYKEIQDKTGNPTYGLTQLNNLWKTVNTFSEAYGVDISFWGWNPPTPPQPQIKIVPRPVTVNRLMHKWYTNDRYENALIRTLLTVGFHTGMRPEELLILKVHDIKFKEGYIIIREQKKRYRERQVWIDDPVLNSRQQNSLKNWVEIWRPKAITNESGDYLFIQKNGIPFPSEDALRNYLAPFVKPVWNDFKPKIMRDWSAIARLIRTKIETRKWDTRVVKNDLGHNYESTTENYIRFAENYYRRDPYDWLRSVLKFHPHSKRMKQYYGSSQEKTTKILTNEKKGVIEVRVSPVEVNGPVGVIDFPLLLKISTNDHKTRLLKRLHFSFFFSFIAGIVQKVERPVFHIGFSSISQVIGLIPITGTSPYFSVSQYPMSCEEVIAWVI